MKNFFSENLENLMKKHSLSQRAFAENLGVSNTAISRYIKGENEPSASVLLNLKEKYNINIDDFLTRKIDFFSVSTKSATISFNSNYDEKFIGNFLVYYYNTSFYKGKVDSLAYNTLKYGVLSIFKDSKKKTIANMLLFKSRTDAEIFKEKLDKLSFEEIEKEYQNNDDVYVGTIDFNFTQIFINITNQKQNDKGLIILNNPPTDKSYIGGLGTINSVSRARELMPCVQFVIVSKHILNKSEGELYSLLSLDTSDINVKNETEQLINLFKNLYLSEDNNDMFLEEYQKVKIIENCLENLMRDLLDANVFRYAKISNSEDDDFYRLIKEVAKGIRE